MFLLCVYLLSVNLKKIIYNSNIERGHIRLNLIELNSLNL